MGDILKKLLGSRRFVITVLFMAFSLGLGFLPDTGDALLMKYFPFVAGAVMVGLGVIGAEDAVKAWKTEQPTSTDGALLTLLDELRLALEGLQQQAPTDPASGLG